MRVSILPFVVAGLALAQQAAASPIRVVVVTSHSEVSTSNFRFGHPTVDMNMPAIAPVVAPTFAPDNMGGPQMRPHRHGCGKKMKEKALEWANTFRTAFGFAPIAPQPDEPHPHHPHYNPGMAMPIPHPIEVEAMPPPLPARPIVPGEVHILPFIGTPNPGDGPMIDHPMHHTGPFPVRHRICGPFFRRLHFAITALGPWEGRAVAFVLGCGIGVLLRMVWVLGVVFYRVLRGNNSHNDENTYVYDVVVFDQDAESIVLPPPEYTDEKVALVAFEQPKAQEDANKA